MWGGLMISTILLDPFKKLTMADILMETLRIQILNQHG